MAEGGEVSFSSGSEIVFDFFCELCNDDNKQVEAEGYCVDCREYLCELCFTAHKRTRSTRRHVLQDKSIMPKNTPLSTDRVSKDITTKCKVHSGKPVEYYCKSHAALGCSACFISGHRGCSGIDNIVDISENILESQVYMDFIIKLQLIQNKSRDIEARARENKAVSRTCCTEVVLTVRKLKEEAAMMLNELEQNTVTLAKKMMSEDEEKMESVVEDCKVLSEKIEQLSTEFASLQSSKRVCQIYVNMRETEGQVKKFQENISNLEEANVVRTFTFEANDQLTSFLRSQDVLGTISHHFQQVRTQSSLTTKDSDQHQQVRIPGPVTIKDPSSKIVKTRNDICISSNSDTANCCITGSAVVAKNRLIITDSDNSKVKLVDTHTNTILSELKLSSAPWDITVFNRTQAAVTLPSSNKILMMKVSPLLAQEREITVHGTCRGIAYNQDRLLVTYTDKPRLEIINLRGKVVRTLKNGSDGSKLFACPWHVCVSRDGETIYVSDGSRHTVTSLTCDGVVKAVYKDKELRDPRKVCTDHHGNVYVCGCLSRNVHMITADCKKIKVILTRMDGLDSYVYSVSYCQDTNRLFIGKSADVVKIYKLS